MGLAFSHPPKKKSSKGWRACLLGVGFAVALIAPASVARANEEQELEAAKARMATGNYAEAEERLRRMVDPNGEPCPPTPEPTDHGCQVKDRVLLAKAREY